MTKFFTLDDLYHPDRKIRFEAPPAADVFWLDDDYYVRRVTDPKTRFTEWHKVNAADGEVSAFFDAERMEAALRRLPGMPAEESRRLAHLPNYAMSPDRRAAVINYANGLFYYRWESDRAVRMTSTSEPEAVEEFSPDGKLVSFVRGGNIHVVDIETGSEWALTGDGNSKILNGRLDWVYQEELYGRGNFKGYWWSPDSSAILYLQLDESPLREFPVIDHTSYQPEPEITFYPLAGTPNPKVRIGIVPALGGNTTWIDTFQYESIDFLIVRAGWTPDSRNAFFLVQDREQRWVDLQLSDRTGAARTLVHEAGAPWVHVTGEPKWLKDGSFLWASERTGWRHLYRYGADGTLKNPITSGQWEVRSFAGVDEPNGFVYFSATADSPIAANTYRVRMDGAGMERLTEGGGTHRTIANPGFSRHADYWSDLHTPAQLRLLGGSASAKSNESEPAEVLKEYTMGRTRLLQVPARDGFPMEALMILPPDFDPDRKYPVLSYTYSGPQHPQVANAWGGEKYLWHQMLAQKGYIIWICDNRTASGKGAQSAWPVYRNAGELELRDLEDGIAWLKSHRFVDASRIGLWGWSYGGFMTAYAMTHSTTFKIGIAGAPVTDWRHYDSVYTERYMATPQNNPQGYEKSSCVRAAANLHGKLLLIHGAMDDNVHIQNTIQFIYELQKAGKQFELMVYPRTRHSVTDPLLLLHMRTLMTEFVLQNL